MAFHRRVIVIRAEDSPNVALALEQQRIGIEPTGEDVLPGVLSWALYKQRRATWDSLRQCVGLDGNFYEGPAALLYPPEWRARAINLAAVLPRKRRGLAIGVDPAEGGDSSSWSVVDKQGLIFQASIKTPDTSIIPKYTLNLMSEYGVPPKNVMFDRGGGGKQHADNLRDKGHRVRDVGFGESAGAEISHLIRTWETVTDERKEQTTFKNRRAQMYYVLRLLLDKNETPDGFGIPVEYQELHRQMAPMPLKYNEEGIIYLPPKQKRDDRDTRVTIHDILGCSPDELDSLVLAVWAMSSTAETMSTGAALF